MREPTGHHRITNNPTITPATFTPLGNTQQCCCEWQKITIRKPWLKACLKESWETIYKLKQSPLSFSPLIEMQSQN
jgi:hypothetical protein